MNRIVVILLLTVACVFGQEFNARNLRLTNVPAEGTPASVNRIYALGADNIGESLTPTNLWRAVVLTGDVDTVDIAGISTFSRTLLPLTTATAWGAALNQGEWYPEDYGAVANDGSSDTAGIQGAIDACFTAGGGVVKLRPGTYRITDTNGLAILTKTGVVLRGSGMAATELLFDNALANGLTCVIAPFGYNTATTPYSAHEMHVEDLTVSATQHTIVGNAEFLHNLIGIAHCPKARLTRVGFDTTYFHFAEFNSSRDIILKDCATVGNGNHASAKFQVDAGGSCGQASGSADILVAVTGSATRASGTQTLLTVASTTGMRPNDVGLITGANGASASTYNAIGGYRVTEVVSATEVAIDLAWPGNATTAGNFNIFTPVTDITIDGYTDIQPADATQSGNPYVVRFLELTHTTYLGVYRNITLKNSTITLPTYSDAIASPRRIIGIDGGAYPMELTGVNILNNLFVDGGHTALTLLMQLHVPYDANYPRRKVTDINIIGNRVRNCGLYHFLLAGDAPDDSNFRTSVTPANMVYGKVTVRDNYIEPIQRGSFNNVSARPSRIVRLGLMEEAVVENNILNFPNVAPSNLYGSAWVASGTVNYGFMFDNIRNLRCSDNHVTVRLTQGNAVLNLQAFVFSVGAFEVSGVPGYHQWENNIVQGIGAISTNLAHTYLEVNQSATFRANWTANSGNYWVRGVWRNNRGTSDGPLGGDTWSTNYANHNTPADAISGSDTTAAEADTWGRHDWWDGQEVIQTFSNAAVTVDPLTTVLMQTGTMSASRAATLPYASLGRRIKALDQSGSVTNINTVVLTRVGTDTISGANTLALDAAYDGVEIIPNKSNTWTQLP